LNGKAMVTLRQRASAVRNILWRVWNSRSLKVLPGYKRRYKAETDLRLMRAKPIRCESLKHFAGWMSRSTWRVARRKSRFRGLGIRNLDIVERARPITEVRTLLNRCSPPSEKTLPEVQLENLKLYSRSLFDEVKAMVEKTEVQLAGERMRVAGLLG
jgi:hypothetical protein